MVTRIKTSKSLSQALNYNEQKLKQGKAELLSASGFLKEINQLSFYDKLWHFQRLTSLNERATTNTLHVSVNFHESEKLDNDVLIQIADTYMNRIGFGDQPYLVYRHHDSGHPHVHIVSTNIDYSGNRISMHNLGRNQSEKARKEIEQEFKLFQAGNKNNLKPLPMGIDHATRIVYGKSDTRRAISNVLAQVINAYRYTSLAELNAVLKLYNVIADPGKDGSVLQKRHGLIYSILDTSGNKVGMPLKASTFPMKPTLNFLDKKYAQNEPLRIPHKKRISTIADWTLNKGSQSLTDFIKELSKEQIDVVLRKNKEGLIYGITYVDHRTKCVFNGSDLGKSYSAKAILERCQGQTVLSNNKFLRPTHQHVSPDATDSTNKSMIDILTRPENEAGQIPYPLKKTAKKKKRKRISL
jgi:Relaxase/Mobilisation nuclease domain